VEGDWPDSCRVNRLVRGISEDADATAGLAGIERFLQWIWRNADVLDFVGRLRTYNDDKAAAEEVGFYGLDLYSLHESIEAITSHGAPPRRVEDAENSQWDCTREFIVHSMWSDLDRHPVVQLGCQEPVTNECRANHQASLIYELENVHDGSRFPVEPLAGLGERQYSG